MNKKYFESKKGSVEEKINTVAKNWTSIDASYTPNVKLSVEKKYFETKPGSLTDAASKVVSEGLDKVNPVAVKKKFDDRKDKDIDNDGDTDSTDKYLHKRRAAISKAVSKEAVNQDDHGEKINQDKKNAAMKKTDQKKPFKTLRSETRTIKLGDKGKTATGKDAGVIELEPQARPI